MTLPTDEIIARARELLTEKERVFIAIDGRCASGKSTLARELSEKLGCNVFRMDDFFLRPEQRTPERYAEPGGNVDRERFFEEVLEPLIKGVPFSYRPFDCKAMSLGGEISVSPKSVNIVEGSYSCHPELRGYYDLRVFLTVEPREQLKRISERSPEKLEMFREKWIPLEERYFSEFSVEKCCDMVFDT